MNNDFIAHHGVKGQRWGVRRYQNPDGTLTAKGKKKYPLAKKVAKKAIFFTLGTAGSLALSVALSKYVGSNPKVYNKMGRVLSGKSKAEKMLEDSGPVILKNGKEVSEEAFDAYLKAKGLL